MFHSARYSAGAIILHWLVALLIIGEIAGGWYMHSLDDGTSLKFDLYQLHKSFGLTILALSVFRLYWRLTHTPPELDLPVPAWQMTSARLLHWAFYGFMIAIPLAGWAMVSASPTAIETQWFGLLHVPHLPLVPGEAIEHDLAEIHELLAYSMGTLLFLHIGAALKHQFSGHFHVLGAILPTSSARSGLFIAFSALLVLAGLYLVRGNMQPENADLSSATTVSSDWEMVASNSKLDFTGTQSGDSFKGSFKNFTLGLSIDPDKLEEAYIEVLVDIASISFDDPSKGSTAIGDEWFDVKAFPTARFYSDTVNAMGDGKYQAVGTLSIKGIEQPTVLDFTMTINGNVLKASGSTTLIRTAFGLGIEANWLSSYGIAADVGVAFEIDANRARNNAPGS